jgi:hypothetical protein
MTPQRQALFQRVGCIVLPLLGIALCMLSIYLLGIRPALRVLDAREWQPVSCRILSSKVTTYRSSGSSGTLHRVDITFAYEYGGKTYTSDRYDFMGDSGSGGYDSKVRVVAQHPVGSTKTCYVNPAPPHDAVLDRGLPARMFWVLIPLILLPIAFLGLILALMLAFAGDS